MKCTGKFKDDFDNICLLKNIKYVPEIISRSKRPGSSLQNAAISQQMLMFQQQSDLNSQTTKTDKRNGGNMKSKVTVVATNIDVDHEIEQNPGNI